MRVCVGMCGVGGCVVWCRRVCMCGVGGCVCGVGGCVCGVGGCGVRVQEQMCYAVLLGSYIHTMYSLCWFAGQI